MHLTHGDTVGVISPEYKAWSEMKQRCYNAKNTRYADWGGRGIQVCVRWLNFYANFLNDMGRKSSKQHSLDRIDNDLGYEPHNCRWATKQQQIANRRRRKDACVFMAYQARVGIMVFRNRCDAGRQLNLDPGTISHCLANRRNSHKGYEFARLEE